MIHFEKEAHFGHAASIVRAWHFREGALARMIPPFQNATILEAPAVHEGALAKMKMHLGPFSATWHAKHHDVDTELGFSDTQIKGPFRAWVHRHEITGDEQSAILKDKISFKPPLPGAGSLVSSLLDKSFAYRNQRLEHDLNAHALFSQTKKRFAITGATGFVGQALCAFLRSGGHEVKTISRSKGDILWNLQSPDEEGIETLTRAFEDVDVVVHLAGESIFGFRWTKQKRARIMNSRVKSTQWISQALARTKNAAQKTLVSSSGTGFYGNQTEQMHESDARGEGFLADVCEAWEAACSSAKNAGVRTTHLRTGLVLAANGGLLERMIPAFKTLMGGPVGDPNTRLSVLGLDEMLDIILRASTDDELRGPVNATQFMTTQRELADALGAAMNRPSLMRVPTFAAKLAMGADQVDELISTNCHAPPSALVKRGHLFRASNLEDLLKREMGNFE